MIRPGDGNAVINGQDGNDNLKGQGGYDQFEFASGWGNDTLYDFDANDFEKIRFVANTGITNFLDLRTNHLSENGAGSAVISSGVNTLTLSGIPMSDVGATGAFSEADFIFG